MPPGVTSLAGPTCPVCWPWRKIPADLAALHRTWHTLITALMKAHSAYNEKGLEIDRRRVDRTLLALQDFEAKHPGLPDNV